MQLMPDRTHSIALAHHWLTTLRGGEKVLARLADLFPEAPIYTLLARREKLPPELTARDIRTSWLQHLRFIPDLQRRALPLLPAAVYSLNVRDHDVVICSDAANIKGLLTRPDALKICYCHSPMRYVWDLYDEYLAASGFVARNGLRLCASFVRKNDYAAAQTVTAFIANSRCVADRIARCYNQPSVVIHPPVDTDFPSPVDEPDDFYLVVGEHVSYKRNDLAVQVCNQISAPLRVIGGGPLLENIRRQAGKTVQVLGWQSDDVVRDHMRRCRALIFCGEEDFGMVPVEVQAAGRPVIAYAKGGALETVVADRSGVFFEEQTCESLVQAIRKFEVSESLWPPSEIQAHAAQFSISVFRQRFMDFYNWCLERFQAQGARKLREDMAKRPPPL